MRAPSFWRRDGICARMLAPLGRLYALAGEIRFAWVHACPPPVPVLCVGNLVAGGAGKTPVALALGRRLMDRGVAVHFLIRGYGGTEAGPLRVDAARHRAADVGDEALLLAELAPTWVARNRRDGCYAAAADGAGVVVMDDGFQNPALLKTVSVVVVDGRRGFGNGRPMPAGPLRELVAVGIERADAMIMIGDDEEGAGERVAGLVGKHFRMLRADVRPGPEAADLAGRRMVAFAGIADPDKFFETLRAIGCHLMATRSFPDHHPYGAREVIALRELAVGLDAGLITTEKDIQRMTPEVRAGIEVLTIDLEWRDEDAVDAMLGPLIRHAR